MKKLLLLSLSFILFSLPSAVHAQDRQYYQIKIYSCDTDSQLQMTDQYLKKAYLPALKSMKIGPVGVFKPRSKDDSTLKQIYVLVPFSSLEQFETLETKLAQNNTFLKLGSNYIETSHDHPPYKRVASILLKAFKGMPVLKTPNLNTPRKDRVYELRSYESPTEAYNRNKVAMFHDGEIKLFNRLKSNAVFYGEVLSGPKMPNLMYMTTYSDQKSRDEHWDAFSNAPEWTKLKTNPKYQHNVSHVDIIFLYPTEYSDY